MTVSDPSSAVPLPPERAFVIQLQAATHGGAEPFAGRAEHVASGEAARFGSIPELIAFVRHVLATDGHLTADGTRVGHTAGSMSEPLRNGRTPGVPEGTRRARASSPAPRRTRCIAPDSPSAR